MVDVIAHAKVTDVIYAQLSTDADLYKEIMEIAKRENIKTGLVLSVVGGLRAARLSMPVKATDPDSPPGVLELKGMMECSGFGHIGHNLDTYDSAKTSGIYYKEGEPHLHVHLTVTHAGTCYMGHLIEGTIVRSLHPKSHFTITLAKTEGAELFMRVSKERTEKYPRGIPTHDLQQV
ncbi:MAG: DNA-binding protein [Alphaproteobacteria bacterium]|nr:DNA-binding protein [Alphaproteobacteria bacterium]